MLSGTSLIGTLAAAALVLGGVSGPADKLEVDLGEPDARAEQGYLTQRSQTSDSPSESDWPQILTPNRDIVVTNPDELGTLPPVITDISAEFQTSISGSAQPNAYGSGYVIGRVREWKTASNGLLETGYKRGTFSSVAGLILGFTGNIPAMTVGAILSAVGMVAAPSNTVQAKTYISHRYLYRDGQGRWSTDPNTTGYWHNGYRVGRWETFRHVWGARQNPTTLKWSQNHVDYTSTPARAYNTPKYLASTATLAQLGASHVQNGVFYSETWW